MVRFFFPKQLHRFSYFLSQWEIWKDLGKERWQNGFSAVEMGDGGGWTTTVGDGEGWTKTVGDGRGWGVTL